MNGAATFVDTFGMLSPGNRHSTTPEDIANWNFDEDPQTNKEV